MHDTEKSMQTNQILITGATGQVGGELLKLFPHVLAPTRAELDLADPDSIRAYLRATQPTWIINPAAYTAVDKAESEPELAHAINAEAPRILGEEAARLGAAVLHFSTDYVFPGEGSVPYTEDAPTGPLGVYGATKLAGELALAATGAAHLIFRTSWVYGATGKNFLLTVLRVAAQRPEMKIVDDQHGAPTWSHDLAQLSAQILAQMPSPEAVKEVSGIYHAVSSGETTWFGFASEALHLRRLSDPQTAYGTLLPIPGSEYPTPARRPQNSRLDCSKLLRTFNIRLPRWQDSLEQVVASL